MKSWKPQSNTDFAMKFAAAWDHVDESPDELRSALEMFGCDVEKIGDKLETIANDSFQNSPYHWKNSSSQIEAARQRRRSISTWADLTKEQLVKIIQEKFLRVPALQAQFRNYDDATEDDLRSLLHDLEYLERNDNTNEE